MAPVKLQSTKAIHKFRDLPRYPAKFPFKRILKKEDKKTQSGLAVLKGSPAYILRPDLAYTVKCCFKDFTGKLTFQFHITLESRFQSTFLKREMHFREAKEFSQELEPGRGRATFQTGVHKSPSTCLASPPSVNDSP